MRLVERSRMRVEIAPRVRKPGALGGLSEAFSEERTVCWGSILPQNGEMEADSRGLSAKAALRILIPGDAVVQNGDGIWAAGELYIVQSVRRWSAHLELDCEARS